MRDSLTLSRRMNNINLLRMRSRFSNSLSSFDLLDGVFAQNLAGYLIRGATLKCLKTFRSGDVACLSIIKFGRNKERYEFLQREKNDLDQAVIRVGFHRFDYTSCSRLLNSIL